MKYPMHHHMAAGDEHTKCAICGSPRNTAYMVEGGYPVYLNFIKKGLRGLFKFNSE